jgi:uncharacterized protein YdaU (DUF1376 family)
VRLSNRMAAALHPVPLVSPPCRCRVLEAAVVLVKGFPYVPWYHGDFLRSTASWTLIERAAYWMLLCAQWESGPLPNDLTRLANIAGTDMTTMTSLWLVVGKKFPKTRAGLVNKRMAVHRAEYMKYRQEQSERGKKGMASRWGKQRGDNVVELRRDTLERSR